MENDTLSAPQEVHTHTTKSVNFIDQVQQKLDSYGIAVDVAMVIVIVIFIEYLKKPFKKTRPGLLPWLPLIVCIVVPVFIGDVLHTHTDDPGLWHYTQEYAKRSLFYLAGSYIVYNLLWEKLLRRK